MISGLRSLHLYFLGHFTDYVPFLPKFPKMEDILFLLSSLYCDFMFFTLIDINTRHALDGLSPCHRREFNPKGGPYKMFQKILSFVTKTFQNMLVFKILNEGKWCFWHSISIT